MAIGGGTLLFNPSPGCPSHGIIRFPAHSATPFRSRPRTDHSSSSCCTYRKRDSLPRCLAIKTQPNKGPPRSPRNAKSNSMSTSETSTQDEANSQRQHLTSLLKKIQDSIKKTTSVPEPNMLEHKHQSLDPKSKEKEPIHGQMKSTGSLYFDKVKKDDGNKSVAPQRGDIKSSGYESTFAILRRDDKKKVVPPLRFDKLLRDNGNNAAAPSYFGKKKSSGAPSNFEKFIRDDGESAVSVPADYKPPRPASRFVRRSPIPVSDPVKEEAIVTEPLKKNPPSAIVTEPLKKMSISDKLQAIIDKPRPPKPEPKWDLNEILKMKISPKTSGDSGIAKSEPKLEVETVTLLEAEPELETNPELGANPELELEAMTLSELKDIAKARGFKGYSKLKKAKLVEILKDTPS